MVINWTKIIILVIIIVAFTGIIVGIVLAFRAQCPDGKIFDKTCKKCVTKCPDGYILPTKEDGIDCDSKNCIKDCKDQCQIDNDTCGNICGQDCCGKGESCSYNITCEKNNCPKDSPEIYCDESIGQICSVSPGQNAFCRTGAQKCDSKYTNKCPTNKEFCCSGDNVCLESDNGSLFCCSKDEGISKSGCCPKDRIRNDKICCPIGQKAYGDICCNKEPCNGVCCDEDEGCNKDNKCVAKCANVTGGLCNPGQFCIDNNQCVNDLCDWGDFDYDPLSIKGKSDNIYRLCNIGTLDGASCNSKNVPNVKGVWARDFDYINFTGSESCRTAKIKSNEPTKCSENMCKNKIEQNGLIFASYDTSGGLCKGVIDCNQKIKGQNYLPSVTNPDSKPEGCLDNGVCCEGKSCGGVCIGSDEYCLLDENEKLCGEHFDNIHQNDPGLINQVASKDPNWCLNKCLTGWGNDTNKFCTVPTCSNVNCATETDPAGNPGFTQFNSRWFEAPSRYTRSNCDSVGYNVNGNGLYCCAPNEKGQLNSDGYTPNCGVLTKPINPGCVNNPSGQLKVNLSNNECAGGSNLPIKKIFYGLTCDSSCKLKGYKSGTLHGISPFCDQSCTGKCGTNTCFKGEIVGAAWSASTDVVDYGEGCDVGGDGRVCCCNN